MTAGELNDDNEQPAPLPAHERDWRHPSEVGREAWMLSEPPIIIGRGLTATTGAIGVMIALAVLWTMLPTRAGRSAVVSVRSTLATGSLVVSTSLRLSDTPTTSTISSNTVAPATTVLKTVDPPAPMPTYNVQQTKTLEDGAVAVAVSGSSLVITTAYAVSADDTVELLLTDGSTEMAQVLFVDQDSGLAVLATHTEPEAMAFTVAEISPGDELTVTGEGAFTFTVGPDGTLDDTFAYDDAIREGTPLMNQDGDLVALCSHAHGGQFVAIGDIEGLQRTLADWSGKIWMGIVFDSNAAGQLVINAVDPGGPAATAGLRNGDILIAIGDTPVADNATFVEALSGLMPGDTVQLTIRNANGEDLTMTVELGAS